MSDYPHWQPAGIKRDNFGDFVVQGVRYLGDSGRVAWHATSYPRSRNREPRQYWVTENTVYEWGGFHVGTGNDRIVTGPLAADVDSAERASIFNAVTTWNEQSEAANA